MNALVTIRDQATALVDEIAPNLIGLLKESGLPFERFKATFAAAVVNNPQILSCDRTSIVQSITKCAIDGLMPDNREAAMVPFRTKVKDPATGRDIYLDLIQYMPMIAGVRKRARELGGIIIDAEEVCENDLFDAEGGDTPYIHHKRAPLGKPRGEVIGAFAIFRDADGKILHREIMDKEDIERARNVSRAKNGPGWTSFYAEMARKSVARRGAKSVPNVNDKLRAIVERDDDYVDFEQASVDRATKNIDHNPLVDKPRQHRQIENSGQAPMEQVKDRAHSSAGQEQRASNAQVDGSNPSGPTTTSSSPLPSGGEDDHRQGGERRQPDRFPAELFSQYAAGLGRMATETNVRKAHDMWWKDHPKPQEGTPDHLLASLILQANIKRAKGEINADGFADDIDALIADSFEGI